MKLYFSGFSLSNESEIFKECIIKNDFTISGFSYGAIKALEYVLRTTNRVDKLQLFSPSFFNNKDNKFKRMQLMYFKKDSKTYCDNFLINCGFTESISQKYFKMGSYEELEVLLYYIWDENKIKELIKRGIEIEIYLGSDDKIIDAYIALEFFKPYVKIIYIKNKGHIL